MLGVVVCMLTMITAGAVGAIGVGLLLLQGGLQGVLQGVLPVVPGRVIRIQPFCKSFDSIALFTVR